jgi:hypothetical protein
MSRFLARYSMSNDTLAEARRAREAEWQSMHRRPDTQPADRTLTPAAAPSRFSLAALVRRVTTLRPGSQRLGESRSRHRL